MTENKRFTVKQRQGATIYSIIDYYGELPLSEGMYYKSNAEKLCKWLNTQHELLNTLYNENEQLKQDKTNLHRTMSRDRVRYLQFRDKVFDLIDEKIQYYEHKPFSASISNPMSVNFDEDVDRLARLSELEQLKKELEL